MFHVRSLCVLLLLGAGDVASATTLMVTNTNDSGAGSLRQAILAANANVCPCEIDFAIPGEGVHTIALASALPAIVHQVNVNGYSQPGASPNTNPPGQGFNTVLQIEIDCTNTGGSACLVLDSGNESFLVSLIQGLVLNRCPDLCLGVGIDGAKALVYGNFIGTDPAGDAPGGDAAGTGISIAAPEARIIGNLVSMPVSSDVSIHALGAGDVISGNLIGTNAAGTAVIGGADGIDVAAETVQIGDGTAAGRNVISGGHFHVGVILDRATSGGAKIQGNFIGTDVTGTRVLGNHTGIQIHDQTSATIASNVIGGSDFDGVSTTEFQDVSQVVLTGNFIGTDPSATLDLGNGALGIFPASSWGIGSTDPGQGNVIAYNRGGGVTVAAPVTGVSIRGNRFFANGGLGIDLYDASSDAGVSPNDPGDGDDGGNHLQNFPLILSVAPGTSTTEVHGILNSSALSMFNVDLYSNSCARRPHAPLEGADFLMTFPVTTDASGSAFFSVEVPAVLAPGDVISATATAIGGNTSEFSQPIVFSSMPESGPPGGAFAALSGMAFEPGATVTVGGVPATDVATVSSSVVTATMPALPAGSVNDVVVVDPSGVNGTLRAGWVADFLDVPAAQQFHDFVVALVENGISAGIGGGNFGVSNATLRQQMAVFLLKARHGLCYVPPPCQGLFGDVACPSLFADWIEALAGEGITGGCGGNDYCPVNPVRRDQMAVFLLKAEHGAGYAPPPCTGVFPDVPCTSPFAPWIEQLAAENITSGCGGGNYCPSNPNTRGQMAVFLDKTFGLQ